MDLLNLIKENYTWFFSGIGVFILTLIIAYYKKGKGDNIIKDHSRGIQVQGNIDIKNEKK